jgi:hypothetical protein
MSVSSPVNYPYLQPAATGSAPTFAANGTDANIDLALTPKGTGNIVGNVNSGSFTIGRDSANNAIKFTAPSGNLYLQTTGGGVILFNTGDGTPNQMRVAHTASAVNYVQVTGAVTGSGPLIQPQGSDTNIDLRITPKGTGVVSLMDSGGLTSIRVVPRSASGDTFIEVQRAVGFVDLIAASGVADGDIRFTPKGAGMVRYGTHTATSDTPITGYIEIKDSSGTIRKLAVIT